jgi:hypothetical protein
MAKQSLPTGRTDLTPDQRALVDAGIISASDAYQYYVPGHQFTAGVLSQGFVSPFVTPVQNFIGQGTEFFGTLNALQPRPIYIPNPLGLLTGLREELGEFDSEIMTEVSG